MSSVKTANVLNFDSNDLRDFLTSNQAATTTFVSKNKFLLTDNVFISNNFDNFLNVITRILTPGISFQTLQINYLRCNSI